MKMSTEMFVFMTLFWTLTINTNFAVNHTTKYLYLSNLDGPLGLMF